MKFGPWRVDSASFDGSETSTRVSLTLRLEIPHDEPPEHTMKRVKALVRCAEAPRVVVYGTDDGAICCTHCGGLF
jgi:hypothetical protein